VAIAKLRHPSILAVFDHGEIEGQPYIVTEFVEGGTFADQLTGKPISVQQALDVLQPVAAALDYAHERGVLHRDVKPSNILITKEGAPVLGDFGLARMMTSTERLTRLDMAVGTPEYMAPEQCAGKETGPAADRYSFGVVAFEALTGHVPYNAETPAAVMLAQMQSPLPDPRTVNPALSENVERALLRALTKDPEGRFPSCTAFVRALAATSAADTAAPPVSAPTAVEVPRPAPVEAKAAASTAPPPGAGTRGLDAIPRPALLAGAGVLVVLLALAGVLYAMSASKRSTNSPPGTVPAHGSLIFQAGLSKTAWSTEPTPAPTGSASFAYPGASIDIKIVTDGAGLTGEFNAPALKNYVADLVMKVDAGSDFELDWFVRSRGATETADVALSIQVAQEAMTLYLAPDGASNQALAATIPIPGLQSGTTVELGIVVNGTSIQVYLGGKKVADARETTSTGATTPGFYMSGKSGALHILALRYYAVS
jgi:hypothetical protein